MIPRTMPAGAFAPGRFNLGRLVEGERPDKGRPLVLPVGGLAWG